MSNLISLWKNVLQNRKFLVHFGVSFGLLVAALGAFTEFLHWIELRDGVVLDDPILTHIAARDFTWVTFAVIYLGVALAVVRLIKTPTDFLLAIQAYTVMMVVRSVMMYLTPLNPSEGLIVLEDPLVQFVGSGIPPTKDLFFSGHTSTMFLLYLVITNRRLKYAYLAFTALVAMFVIWQHVHYVIDVAVAPFVAYACYRMAYLWRERTFPELK